ncbi:dynactin subunit 1-like [Heterodontus francisci]|uniref:dynactin subunit 1-like n=1 Tax=Heterodontus francisci TaxID=7792 RepID=UPI00355C29DC
MRLRGGGFWVVNWDQGHGLGSGIGVDFRDSQSSASWSEEMGSGSGIGVVVSESVDRIKDEVDRVSVTRAGARVSSDFATFPHPAFTKAKEEQRMDAICVGKVTLPCPPGEGQLHRIVLLRDQLYDLHSRLIS